MLTRSPYNEANIFLVCWFATVKLHGLKVNYSKHRIFLNIISECKGVHRCQVLQLDGEEEEGGREEGGAEGRIGKASWEKLDLLPLKL